MNKHIIRTYFKINLLFKRYGIGPIFFACIIVKIISFLFSDPLEHSISTLPAYEAFAAAVLFTPFFETFIFQFLLFYAGEKWKLKNSQIIIISSILFAISHNSSLAYVILALLSGIFYNSVYFKIKEKYGTYIAYFFITGIHAIYNCLVWLNVYF